MDVEIIYTGICSFLNPRGSNPTMGDPSVILLRTEHSHGPEQETKHIPFIALDSTKVDVSDTSGFKAVPHPDAANFRYLELDGVELAIKDDPGAGLTVRRSYDDFVAKKDAYWPKAKDQWNRDYVPEKPGQKPKASAVAVYMRLRTGTLKAGRLLDREWKFSVDGNPDDPHQRRFAFEVILGDIPHQRGSLTIVISDLTTGKPTREIRFSPVKPGAPMQLFIGNNTETDIHNAVNRRNPTGQDLGDHFRFLNQVANPALGFGPFPEPVDPIQEGPDGELPVGGEDGYCGPGSGNN